MEGQGRLNASYLPGHQDVVGGEGLRCLPRDIGSHEAGRFNREVWTNCSVFRDKINHVGDGCVRVEAGTGETQFWDRGPMHLLNRAEAVAYRQPISFRTSRTDNQRLHAICISCA